MRSLSIWFYANVHAGGAGSRRIRGVKVTHTFGDAQVNRFTVHGDRQDIQLEKDGDTWRLIGNYPDTLFTARFNETLTEIMAEIDLYLAAWNNGSQSDGFFNTGAPRK